MFRATFPCATVPCSWRAGRSGRLGTLRGVVVGAGDAHVVGNVLGVSSAQLDRIARVLPAAVWGSSNAGPTQQPEVANGASELLPRIFADAGGTTPRRVHRSGLYRRVSNVALRLGGATARTRS